jgi:hypothetical protein
VPFGAASCVVFLALCETMRVNPQDAFTATKNLMVATDGQRPEFRTVADFLKHEVVR